MPVNESVAALNLDEYKYGFRDEENYIFKSRKGLDESIVREISGQKNEPQWMLDLRLKALKHALKVVTSGINKIKDERRDMAVLLITHYQRMLNYITPDRVHVMVDGRIIRSGGPELALELEERGYDWLREGAAV